ncbi:amino acid ABC transporter permease [Prosthecomicrobium sp. N25]|uniref:amino acid ABC transporter permease n=1 Tax=Prosthecomicrobium sp. N25 TaxID=3129254 RepID=UPI003077DAF4
MASEAKRDETSGGSWLNNPEVRGVLYQVLTLALVVAVVWTFVHNAAVNLQQRNIAQGFGFLGAQAGFDISQSLIDYPKDSSYGRAILVGLANTALVAGLGIVLATLLGFIAGIARLSSNFVIQKLATLYVEIVRNLPLLLQILFWYFAVLALLPSPRQSLQPVSGWVFLNNRGLIIPEFVWTPASGEAVAGGLLVAILLSLGIRFWARRRQAATGQRFPTGWTSLGLIVGLPAIAFLATGSGLTVNAPTKSTFNIAGGTRVIPEFMALLLALVIYTGAFIAEIVRAGIMAVSHGQTEAARSLGLRPGDTLRLVVVPQAMRVIIPPLTSQYLNLTKNSSLAVAVGYPDLVYTGGTVLNQTGQAIEVIAIWMLIYLGTSLATSAFMNWFNGRMAIVER